MKRKGIILVFLIIVVTVFIVYHGLEKKDGEGVLKIISDKADLYVRDFHYTEVGDGESTWVIDADSAQYIRKKNLALLKNVKVKFFTSDGKTFFMTGKEGQLYTDSRNMDLRGNVQIISDSGDRFVTECINYSYSEKKVYTQNPVTLENSQLKITGVGLTIMLTTKTISLLSDVSAFINDFNISP
ncbi:MAG: LPS export ABC transporter periplasmic protein LptC [Deltaproteobacteria bacterium]|nr:LPS export ABC transporter periplasmic protein LptC [Deltaproteobacteria bacterium]